MDGSVDQIFVRCPDRSAVESALKLYVSEYGNKFVPCSSTHLEGKRQVLSALVRKKRDFRLLTEQDWTVVWEIVAGIDFADPSVAKFLSTQLKVETIWASYAYDFNIWAFMIFDVGELISESFLPKSYFDGFPDSDNRFDYGSCIDTANEFNRTRSLPFFLDRLVQVERSPKLAKKLSKLVCKIQ